MIQRLGVSSLSFKANESLSARDGYKAQMDKNFQTAQKQNNIVTSMSNNQIPMQGAGQKLDVIA